AGCRRDPQVHPDVKGTIAVLTMEPLPGHAIENLASHLALAASLPEDVAEFVARGVRPIAHLRQTDTRRKPLGGQGQVVNNCERPLRGGGNGFDVLVTNRHVALWIRVKVGTGKKGHSSS